MAGRLDGKVAVITGGGNGIGRATALRFLDEGAAVVIADLNETNGQETVALARQAGHAERVRFVRADVTQEADVAAAIAAAPGAFGRLDCVFNNAGVAGAFGPITHIDAEEWDWTFAVLVRGVFLGMKHGARVMKAQGQGGCFINTASIAGLSRRRRTAGVLGGEGGGDQSHPRGRGRAGAASHPRQRHLPGRHPDAAAAPRQPGGDGAAAGAPAALARGRQARAHRRGRAVPRQRRRALRHRRGAGRRRRPHGRRRQRAAELGQGQMAYAAAGVDRGTTGLEPTVRPLSRTSHAEEHATHHYQLFDPLLARAEADAMVDLCERFGRYGMYSQEASESEIGQGLAQRHDAVMNFIKQRRPRAAEEPLAVAGGADELLPRVVRLRRRDPDRRHRAVPAPRRASSTRRAPCTAGR